MKRILVGIMAGMAAIFIGLGFLLPSLAKLREYEALSIAGLLFTGVLLVLAGVAAIIYALARSTRKGILAANVNNAASE